ncbi:MAG: hypothetical protein ABSB75_01380 [Candidatus Limnocylindrales bacterium]
MWARPRGLNLVDTPEMDTFFAGLDRLNEAQLMAMAAAWGSADREQRQDAWAVVRAVGKGQGLTREIDRVRARALAWAAHGDNLPGAYSSPAVAVGGFGDPRVGLQLKMAASEGIVDAALATALGFRLDAQTRETLLGPWLRATEASE